VAAFPALQINFFATKLFYSPRLPSFPSNVRSYICLVLSAESTFTRNRSLSVYPLYGCITVEKPLS